MKKTIYLSVLFLFLGINSVKAQWVPIPSVFAGYISTYIDSNAINGNLLDTTNTNITGLQNLTINPSTVTDITGIQYFDNLQNFVMRGNIITMPQLPSGLKTLEVRSTVLTTFSAPLPSGLTSLKCYSSDFTAHPALPATVSTLIFSSCSFLTAINSLPAALTYLDAEFCTSLLSISALPGGLQHLSVRYSDPVIPFPSLPASLTYLDVSHTLNRNFTSMPPNLYHFDCSYCDSMTALPAMPNSLDKLYADHCKLSSTSTMPVGMYDLRLSYNPLTSISDLPDTVWNSLQLNNLTSLTSIPGGNIYIGQSIDVSSSPGIVNSSFLQRLKYAKDYAIDPYGFGISARNNNTLSLPAFNTRIAYLNFSNTPISYIGGQSVMNGPNCGYGSYPDCEYPFTEGVGLSFSNCSLNSICDVAPLFGYHSQYSWIRSVGSLDMSYNDLTDDNCLDLVYVGGHLNLSNNQITDMTARLSSNSADLSNNQISCLSYIDIATTLNVTNNPINCLPNIPGLNFVCTPPLTACVAGNSNNCPVTSLAGGVVFEDLNQNGIKNPGEGTLPGYYVMMTPYGYIHQSDSNGYYDFNCEVNVNYTIFGSPTYPYRRIVSSPYSVQYTQNGMVDTFHNIGVYIQPNVNDMYVKIFPNTELRPGFEETYGIVAKNIGTTVQNGTVEMYFYASLVYQSSTPPGVVNGNKITWNVSNLNPLDTFYASARFIVPTTLALGDTIRIGAHMTGNAQDTTPLNNRDTLFQIAVGSYDPNDKLVSPSNGLSQEEIAEGDYLYYTVRFQNTGTASAINIRVEDTLSAALNLNTFEFIHATHRYTWKVENNVLYVYFDNVHLPDSGADEQGSHGFFAYRIRPYSSASVGDQIRNTAHIYFDFNPAIVTNTVVTDITTLIPRQPKAQYLCSGEPLMLTIQTSPSVTSLAWYKDGVALNVSNDTLYIDSTTVNDKGLYTCYITTAEGAEYASDEVGVEIIEHGIRPYFSFSTSATFCLVKTASLFAITPSPNSNQRFYWYKNDSLVQSGTYAGLSSNSGSVFREGDTIRCVMTDTFPCAGLVSFVRDTVIHFSPSDTVNFFISPQVPRVCAGESVELTAHLTNGGNPSIHWYRNGVNVGQGSTFTFNNVQNNDTLRSLAAVSSSECHVVLIPGNYLARDTVVVIADDFATPNLKITSNNGYCQGGVMSYTALANNEGSNAQYIWMKDGNIVGTDTSFYLDSNLLDGEIVQCKMITTGCSGTVPDTLLSNAISFVDSQQIPSVSIGFLNYNTYCDRASMAANPLNAGPNVTYQWKVNGVDVSGAISRTVSLTPVAQGDTITCVINPQLGCRDTAYVSNKVLLPGITPATWTVGSFGSNQTYICPRQSKQFLPAVNGNSLHSMYGNKVHWYKNGILQYTGYYYNTGTNDTTDYNVHFVTEGIGCWLPDTSNTIYIQVAPAVITPSVQIVSSPNTNCSGDNITFSALAYPAGSTGSSVWYQNGQGQGNPSSITRSNLNEGDVITLRYTPSGLSTCATSIAPIWDSVTIHLANNIPSVSISSSSNVVCGAKGLKSFTAEHLYGGAYPSYQWKKNGIDVGINSDTYIDSVSIGDTINCLMISNNPCASPLTATSNSVVIIGGSNVSPTISISTPQNNVCSGTAVTFIATATNAGISPVYQWKINGTNTGNNSSTYSSSLLVNNDVISCELISSESCALPSNATSNSISMSIVSTVIPEVTISVSPSDTVCKGTSVSFVATGTNGGTSPSYEWLLNGTPAGNLSNTYNNGNLNDGDLITAEMISNATCATPSTVLSSPVSMNIIPLPVKPVVTQNGNVLTSSSSASNQWYLNNIPITGASQSSYLVTQAGWYKVETGSPEDCRNMSDSMFVIPTGIADLSDSWKFALMPNPAKDFCTLQLNGKGGTFSASVLDIAGREVLSLFEEQRYSVYRFSTETLSAGLYFVKVHDSFGRSVTAKLMVE